MDKILNIKNIEIGVGKPKICIPITGKTYHDIEKQTEEILKEEPDIVEWRVDYYDGCMEQKKVNQILINMKEKLKNCIFLFTFRTAFEGGEQNISAKDYINLIQCAVESGCVDLVDLEYYTVGNLREETCKRIQQTGTCVVMSSHDFEKTPNKDVIIKSLKNMQDAGADIAKFAVMPQSVKDVFSLCEATYEMYEKYAKVPLITMSMGEIGKITRISGQLLGSAVTFAYAGNASAPGQIPVSKMKKILDII